MHNNCKKRKGKRNFLKVSLSIKNYYYIVPNPSTALKKFVKSILVQSGLMSNAAKLVYKAAIFKDNKHKVSSSTPY